MSAVSELLPNSVQHPVGGSKDNDPCHEFTMANSGEQALGPKVTIRGTCARPLGGPAPRGRCCVRRLGQSTGSRRASAALVGRYASIAAAVVVKMSDLTTNSATSSTRSAEEVPC